MQLEADLVALKQQFDSAGYIVVPEFLSHAEISKLVSAIDAHYGRTHDDLNESVHAKGKPFDQFATQVIPWDPVAEGNDFFVSLLDSPELNGITESCLGGGYTGGQSLVMLSPPGGMGQAWHQDCPISNEGYFNVNRLIYVDDVTVDNGAIVIVPGSHRMGPIPEGGPQDAMANELALMPSASALVLLNGLVYHRVTPNRSSLPRTSVNFRAYAAGVPADVCNIGVFRNGRFDFRTNTVVKS